MFPFFALGLGRGLGSGTLAFLRSAVRSRDDSMPRNTKGRERAQKQRPRVGARGRRKTRTALCRVPVPGSGPNNPDVDVWLSGWPYAALDWSSLESRAAFLARRS